jgi:histidinol-phosphate phosphatase family protein
VDAVYYCPHLEDGIIAEYRKTCSCRKPQTGMIEKACRDFSIDLKHSCMVGDRAGDIMLGKNAGIKTVLLESGYGTKRLESDVTPDYQFEDLRGVLKIL